MNGKTDFSDVLDQEVIGPGGMGTVHKTSEEQMEEEKSDKLLVYKTANPTSNTKFLNFTKFLNSLDDKVIGKGQFGVVHLVRNKQTGVSIVVKKFKQERCEHQFMNNDCLQEISCLRAMGGHNNIVELVAVSRNGGFCEPVMMLETMDEDITKLVPRIETYADFYRVYLMLSSGIQHIHHLGFMHRDLKPHNILCSSCYDPSKCVIKIADFGLARRYLKDRKNTLEVVTLWWRAPEVLMKDEYYTPALDIWAVGLILLEIITGERLRGKDDDNQLVKILQLVGSGSTLDTRLTKSKKMQKFTAQQQENVKHLLSCTLQIDPALRSMPVVYKSDLKYREDQVSHPAPVVKLQCMSNSKGDIKIGMRKILFEWLFEVALQEKLEVRAFFRALDLIDRYIAIESNIKKEDLQLIGVASVNIACADQRIQLSTETLVYLCEGTYTACQINDTSCRICHKLDFNIQNKLLFDIFEGSKSSFSQGGVDTTLMVNFMYMYDIDTFLKIMEESFDAPETKFRDLFENFSSNVLKVGQKIIAFAARYNDNVTFRSKINTRLIPFEQKILIEKRNSMRFAPVNLATRTQTRHSVLRTENSQDSCPIA